jgi:hypothetical protein
MIIGIAGFHPRVPPYRSAQQCGGDMDYVEAARLRGEGLGWVVRREIRTLTSIPPLVAEFDLRFSLRLSYNQLRFHSSARHQTADGGLVRAPWWCRTVRVYQFRGL